MTIPRSRTDRHVFSPDSYNTYVGFQNKLFPPELRAPGFGASSDSRRDARIAAPHPC